jgi:hypothetical protein
MVLALWSCKSSTPTGNLTALNTNQNQAGNLASNKYPLVVQGEQPRTTIAKIRDRARKRAEMQQSLLEEYLNELAKKYSLSQEQLIDIQREGLRRSGPSTLRRGSIGKRKAGARELVFSVIRVLRRSARPRR